MTKKLFRPLLLLLLLALTASCAHAALSPLPMDRFVAGPVPKNANFSKDNTLYEDESLTVRISYGTYEGVKYTAARVKISHASQLRAASAQQVRSINKAFGAENTTARAVEIADALNAVVAINSDYFITPDKCQVVMRQGKQIRNKADGTFDVLIIDRNGDFSVIRRCTSQQYKDYYKKNSRNMYQVFCFGPVLVENGRRQIGEGFAGREMIAQKKTQRAAIAQIGPLEYMLIVSDGDSVNYTEGLTLAEFSALCEILGKRASEEGFRIAYNLDGGNSATLVYKRWVRNKLEYRKLNMVGVGRRLSDMICFCTLVK